MFIAALPTTAKKCNQLKQSLLTKWIRKCGTADLGVCRCMIPRRLPPRKNYECSQCQELSMCCVFFPLHHHFSARNMLPFNTSKIFTLSLKLRAFTFSCFGVRFAYFERHIFTKLRTEKGTSMN
jgi:hypothetical protein